MAEVKPDDKYLYFLRALQETGATNMFGAAPYLQEAFPELSKREARQILLYWMDHYEELFLNDKE